MEEKLKPIKCECCGKKLETIISLVDKKITVPNEGVWLRFMDIEEIKGLLLESLYEIVEVMKDKTTEVIIDAIRKTEKWGKENFLIYIKMEALVKRVKRYTEVIAFIKLEPSMILVCDECSEKFALRVTIKEISEKNIKIKPLLPENESSWNTLNGEEKNLFKKWTSKWIKKNENQSLITRINKEPVKRHPESSNVEIIK
ncbi:hypothetical protein KAS79_03410 [Candidatus Parcubacteria bacterium]|nr:hypothetical protein [Candidatus Parcubacteria bacterium]